MNWRGLTVTLLVLAAIGYVHLAAEPAPPIYRASAEILIQNRSEIVAETPPNSTAGDQPLAAADFQHEFELMQSKDVLLPVIKKLGLKKAWAPKFQKPDADSVSDEEAVDYLANKILHFSFKRGTSLADISASSESPQQSADIANGVIEEFLEQKKLATQRALEAVDEAITTGETLVARKMTALDNLMKSSAGTDPSSPAIQQAMKDLATEKATLEAAKAHAQEEKLNIKLSGPALTVIAKAEVPKLPVSPSPALPAPGQH